MTDRLALELDVALGELADDIAWPPTPDLAPSVRARLREPVRSHRAPWRRAVVLALAATLVLAAAVAALTFILPGLRITFVPEVPSATPSAGLGTRFALGERAALGEIAFVEPAEVGAPDEVYVARGGEVVTLLYATDDRLPEIFDSGIGLLVQEIRGGLEPERVEKLVSEVGATVMPVTVNGADGFWIEGPPHLVRYRGPSGSERAEMTRLVGHTLVWQAGDSLFRIESGLSRDATVAIAESIDR